MADGMDHAAQLRGVLPLDRLADAAQAQRAQRVALAAVGAVGRLDLGDDEAHATVSVVTAVSSAAGGAPPPGGPPAPGFGPGPRTLSPGRPRRGAAPPGPR